MSYNSKHTGAEVDALLDKAGTAVQPNNLAAVALSGSYDDLDNKPTIPAEQVNADWNATSGKAQILNKPTIPAAVTESTVSGWGFTKNAGTVTGVKINGSTKTPTSGTVDIGNVATSIKINGSTKNPSNGVVDLGTVLTAHQSLKNINGQSIVGSGNVEISNAYPLVNHGTSNTTFTLQPNTFYVWATVTKLTLTLGSEVSGVANEYLFQFTSGSTATTLSLPSSVKWQEDLTIEKNKTYQVSILNGFATVLAFNN